MSILLLLLSSLAFAAPACPSPISTTRAGLFLDNHVVPLRDGAAEAAIAGCSPELNLAVRQWHKKRQCTITTGIVGLVIWPVLVGTVVCGIKMDDAHTTVEHLVLKPS